ncbi:MAG: ATP-binding protein [Candidatus Xenobiia bacterium LiM19]
MAAQDGNECTNCGACVIRCQFDARNMENGKLEYDPLKCFGCSLCIDTCKAGAITLRQRYMASPLKSGDSQLLFQQTIYSLCISLCPAPPRLVSLSRWLDFLNPSATVIFIIINCFLCLM